MAAYIRGLQGGVYASILNGASFVAGTDATLKGDAAGREFLKAAPEKNGIPRHLLTPQTRLALHPAPNAADFARELAKRGFDKAAALWQEAKAKESLSWPRRNTPMTSTPTKAWAPHMPRRGIRPTPSPATRNPWSSIP